MRDNRHMPTVRLNFSTLDLSRTRFAFSPLFETVMSVRALQDPARFAIHLPWLREAQGALAGLDLTPLTALVRPEGYTPDFLAPPPVTPLPDFDSELQTVLASDPALVRREVLRLWGGAPPEAARPYVESPQAALTRLTDTLADYWGRVMAPHWPQVRAVLEGDMLLRARHMALLGPEAMFGRLSRLIHYAGGVLTLDESVCSASQPQHELQGRGLLLMPSAFVWPRFSTILDPPWQPTLIYSPRGVASLWDRPPPAVDRALALLLGRGRAEVLLSLAAPATTHDLARRLNMAPSSVSEHLSVLRQAGLLDTSRQGRSVYYRLSPTGCGLLDLLGALPEPEPAPAPPLTLR